MQETYDEFIENILSSRGRFACGEEYHERHHIVPKCMGGTNDEENLIDLYAREHFIAHKLLALENPDNEKLSYAWWCMAIQTNQYTGKRYKITAEEYEEIRIKYVDLLSNKMRGENNPMFGKNPYANKTEEEMKVVRQQRSDAASGENNVMYGKHHSQETKDKISEKLKVFMKGEGNPFYGRHHSEETKARLREINIGKTISEERKEILREKNAGKNNPNVHPLYCYELDEFFWGRTEVKDKYENISVTNIPLSCKNSNRTCGRHPITGEPLHWRYATMEEYDNYIEQKGND